MEPLRPGAAGGVAERFREVVRAVPERLAVRGRERAWSYAELDAVARRVARVLLDREPDPGRPVLLFLETDAPQPTTVFGGSLDMSGAPDLTGRKILVVEDDYFLANDTAAALRGAGAVVLGPCPTEERAHDLLEDEMPTHAVLDLNLGGGGPRFEIAHLLKQRPTREGTSDPADSE